MLYLAGCCCAPLLTGFFQGGLIADLWLAKLDWPELCSAWVYHDENAKLDMRNRVRSCNEPGHRNKLKRLRGLGVGGLQGWQGAAQRDGQLIRQG